MAFGAEQHRATAQTALERSGRVEIAPHITLPTDSRNGQFSVSLSSLQRHLPRLYQPLSLYHLRHCPRTTTCTFASSSASSDLRPPAPWPTVTPAPSMPPLTPIYDCVVRKLGLEKDVRIPGCTRGEARSTRGIKPDEGSQIDFL